MAKKKKKATKSSSSGAAVVGDKSTKHGVGSKAGDVSAASAASLDDTIDTSNDVVHPADGGEPHGQRADDNRFQVAPCFRSNFPDLTSETLKRYMTSKQRRDDYRNFRYMVEGVCRHGGDMARINVGSNLLAVLMIVLMRVSGAAEWADLRDILGKMRQQTSQYMNSLNDVLAFEPQHTPYDGGTMQGVFFSALFTAMAYRIFFPSLTVDARTLLLYVRCAYIVECVMLSLGITTLLSLWTPKFIQFTCGHTQVLASEKFYVWQYFWQGAFDVSTLLLLAVQRLAVFYHRYFSGLRFAKEFRVKTRSWLQLILFYLFCEWNLLLILKHVFKCQLIVVAFYVFFDEISKKIHRI